MDLLIIVLRRPIFELPIKAEHQRALNCVADVAVLQHSGLMRWATSYHQHCPEWWKRRTSEAAKMLGEYGYPLVIKWGNRTFPIYRWFSNEILHLIRGFHCRHAALLPEGTGRYFNILLLLECPSAPSMIHRFVKESVESHQVTIKADGRLLTSLLYKGFSWKAFFLGSNCFVLDPHDFEDKLWTQPTPRGTSHVR